ncbi:MAG: sulfotransferase [Acidobacteria bacterium]|nr:sulfotransferase [Acidobacteriota bacterium]
MRRFHFAYLSNLAQIFRRAPAAATMMAAPLISAWRGRFESEHGYIRGWGAPNEGGWLWNRWFPQEYYLDPSYAGRLPVERIRRIVAVISGAMKGSFLNKYVPHSVHVRLLDQIFPGCLFIEVYRDPVDNVRSIVRARADGQDDTLGWLAVKPREWEQYRNADDVMRACAQVCYIHQNIEQDAGVIGRGRRLIIDYSKMCREPRSILEEVVSFFESHQVKLRIKDGVPESFRASVDKRLDEDTERMIAESVEKLWNEKAKTP